MAWRRTWLAIAIAVAMACPAPGRALAQGAGSMEYAVKAAYLFKFAPFVEWPAAAFPSATSPFNLCIVGSDPFGTALDRTVSGQRVGERPVAVKRLARADGASGCHILYVGAGRGQPQAETLRSVRGAPVLTVTDQGPAASGAIIRFVVRDNRVRFEIDTEAAASNRVSISSKLLSLALTARGRS